MSSGDKALWQAQHLSITASKIITSLEHFTVIYGGTKQTGGGELDAYCSTWVTKQAL